MTRYGDEPSKRIVTTPPLGVKRTHFGGQQPCHRCGCPTAAVRHERLGPGRWCASCRRFYGASGATVKLPDGDGLPQVLTLVRI